ncbi:MerR family transcriptional regulator [Alkaliphilus peptidifermentans]|uniref:Putative AdoMet-dependent methyltransferase n=1 Tax=Alkaliphilus peptidifermentans DSM 18978 TaxID=1120976 RepID=A0A1G5HGE0_9FIRM|nr:MerR family transcriptional regulator [Alkaliphilus peptidifermentans]SCY62390.1 putative AdoMet-dependent methyltransferase [Alkaliphilus peptidifermentans DSM 18978]
MNERYSINEAAEIFGITTNKLRFYEKKGILKPKRDTINNYRYYTNDDLIRIQTILMYRVLGLPLDDIKNILDEVIKDNIIDHFYKQWEVINDEIHRLRLMRDSIEGIMDDIYDSKGENKLNKIMESAKRISQIRKIKASWKDRWDFDDWAKTYDISVKNDSGELKIYENYNDVLSTVYEEAIKGINIEKHNVRILDIGVGTGNLSEKFLVEGYDIVGIDQSRKMLNVAKQKFPNLKVRLGEFLNIPFDRNEFDIIVTTYAFHHLNDEEKELAIDEMMRVLKDNGRIIIGDMMFENSLEKSKLMKKLSKEQIDEINDEYYSDIEKLEAVFNKQGKQLDKYKIDMLNFVICVY